MRPPVSYSRIWNEDGSGARRDVQIWKANCPARYVALGNVATNGEDPPLGSIYCVKVEYTKTGSAANWNFIWNDRKSGAKQVVQIYEAKATSSDTQSVRGFGAVTSYNGKPRSPHLLNEKYFNYHSEKPIERIEMFNVQFKLSEEKRMEGPQSLSTIYLENNSNKDQKVTKSMSAEVSEEHSFTFAQSIDIGIEVELKAGIPLITSKSTTISMTSSTSFETGNVQTKTVSRSADVEVVVPPHSKMQATVWGTEYKADIPYTATIRKIFFDGTTATGAISGVYKGVFTSNLIVNYGEVTPL